VARAAYEHALEYVHERVQGGVPIVEHQAVKPQLFGGNGLTREYPMEKRLRDARASLIEDGENNILSLKSATLLSEEYKYRQGL
jgi:alkylation response protein AidB-like acyl-CoA dehydrogenase